MSDNMENVVLLLDLLGIVDSVLHLPNRQAQKLVFYAGPDLTAFIMSCSRIRKVQVSEIQGPLQLLEIK